MNQPSSTMIDTLQTIERRVLWLSTLMIDAANRRDESGDPSETIKIGGHQASCASMTSIMTTLWFGFLNSFDKVAVKPHAAPVYHSIKYLTGEIDRSKLTTLRQFGGLQAYPSRTKDPDVSDFSTGSVGLGAVAPLFSALTHRYLCSQGLLDTTDPARFIALVGDAELDEGNVWEAVADPATRGLGNFMMIVDLNRQSLDRVIPDIAAERLKKFFANVGWHVAEAKYGRRMTAAFEEPGGDALRARIDEMSNEAYQELFSLDAPAARAAFLEGADKAVERWAADHDDDALKAIVTDLGGHDPAVLLDAYRTADAERDQPSVVFAYTIKGWGLPIAGDPMNHAALLSQAQIDALRTENGLTVGDQWDRFAPDSPEGRLCASVGHELNNPLPQARPRPPVPTAARPPVTRGLVSSQEGFGRVLAALADVEHVGDRIVTTAPDVAMSTNLGGWINKVGVYSPTERAAYGGDTRLLKWAPSPSGRHIELGISEMNLFMLLGQLGLSFEHHGEQLFPIGTVYDPFVLRGLDAFVYGLYNDARFILTGTPSGVTLAPEGGAHQSTITASIGIELPNVEFAEPAYATEVDWLLCDAIDHLAAPDGASTYLRLSTRPIDQAPFGVAIDRYGEEQLRQQVIAGGYRLHEPQPTPRDDSERRPGVTIVTTGVTATEALTAAADLDNEGIDSVVVHLTNTKRVYRSWRASFASVVDGRAVRQPSHLDELIPANERHRPIISVHDAASHSLAWIGSAIGTRQYALGVDEFGQSGTIADLYRFAGISAGDIVNAALIALSD